MQSKIRLLFLFSWLVAVGSFGKDMGRPPLLSERFYTANNEQMPTDDRVWNKILIEMDIPGFQPRDSGSLKDCNFANALSSLRTIRESSIDQGYLKVWSLNQDKVFAACDGTQKKDDPPTQPKGKRLPNRANTDFLYQLGSWYFYRHEYPAALGLYKKVEKFRNAPMRPKAAYMVIRTLSYMDQADAAYDKIEQVVSDPSLGEVHGIASNYRFVIMSNTRYSDTPHISPELAKRHLQWLLSVIQVNPEKSRNMSQAISDYNDALTQLNVYFPIYGESSHEVDWWLNEGEPASPRMQAVMDYATKIEIVDWMQAKWAYNIFEMDWLWALHAEANPYWDQNKHIVVHELAQWDKSGNGGWLQLAIARVHPTDPMADVLLQKTRAYLDLPWKSETIEYREWLFDLWQHSIRLTLGQGKTDEAFDLIIHHQDFANLFDGFGFNYRFSSGHYRDYTNILEKTLRWLVYTGQSEQARKFLNAFQKQSPGYFTQWRTLLATNVEESMASGIKSVWSSNPGTSKVIWLEMVNTFSSSFLYRLVSDDRIDKSDRALISRTLLTRAILLNSDPAEIDRAAAEAAKHNPELREVILTSMSGHDRAKYIEFLLKYPRFRPAVFLEYAPNANERKEGVEATAIDTYNHNDNNWWCQFDKDTFSERVFEAAKIIPGSSVIFSEESTKEEFKPYLDKQRVLIKSHPYQSLADDQEIDALEKIPSGPEYLSSYINQWERNRPATQMPEERDRRAANLHRAIRTTRYGCNRNESHEAYSRESFKLLHSRYDDTPWAKATPYWFN